MPQQSDGAAAIAAAAAATSQQILETPVASLEVDDLDAPIPAAAPVTPPAEKEESADTLAGGEGADVQTSLETDPEKGAEDVETAAESETAAAETAAAAATGTTAAGTTGASAAAGTVAVEKKDTAPAAPAASADDAKAQAQQVAQYNAQIAKHNGEWAALQNKIAKGEFDPLDEDDAKNLARLTMERTNLLEQRLALQERQQHERSEAQQIADDWQRWGKSNPGLTIAEGQKILNEEVDRLQKKYPGRDVSVTAIEAFETRVARVIAGKKAAAQQQQQQNKPAPVKAPPVNKGAARVAPVSGGRPAAQKPKTVLERAAAGEYGDLNKAISMDD